MTPSLSESSAPAPASTSAALTETQSNVIGTHIARDEPPEHYEDFDAADRPSITSPQLFTSPSLASEESHLPDSSSKDGIAMLTPPLENGETRLHPLIDEHQIDSSGSKDPLSQISHPLLDAIGQDTSNQYPSPSGGFVPPMTEDEFTLGQVPDARSRQSHDRTDTAEPTTSTSQEPQGIVTVDEADPHQPYTEPGLGDAPRRGSKSVSVQSLSSALLIPRRMSTSSSSSSLGDNHSQAISARSSPSTVAPTRRRSSALQVGGSGLKSVHEGSQYMKPLKIRDYAFPEMDPRHVGARDVSGPSRRMSHREAEDLHEPEASEGDEEEGVYGEEVEEGGSIEEQGLPFGLYNVAYEFAGESQHELSVQVGQKLRLIGHVEGGWGIVIKVKEGQENITSEEEELATEDVDKGLVPEAYLEWAGPDTTPPT